MKQITRREFITRSALGLGGMYLLGANRAWAEAPDERKLNFVFILIDDMGWRDTVCYGSKFYETPNIDKLAAEGMRFTNAYAACPVCSPTRASILTGKYPARLHLTDWIPGHKMPKAKLRGPEANQQLSLEEITIAEALKPAGYISASIGKWHLGKEPFYPEKQGFDLNFGGSHQALPPSYFYPYNLLTIRDGREGEYLTDRLTEEAESFLDTNKDKPFLLYLAHYAVHSPLQAKREIAEKYAAKPKSEGQKNAAYAAMIQSVDESVGRVMAKLDELGIANRTVVIFTSDNGAVPGTSSNAPLRAGKGTLYEGGVREPWIVCWPGAVKPGSTCDVPVCSIDIFPTALDIAGVKADPKHVVDGVSIMPLLRQTGGLKRDAIYWHYPHYHPGGTTPAGAIRDGDYKLIEYFEDNRVEMYNLKWDIGEQENLVEKLPRKAEHLRKKLADWRKSVDAAMPTPNPNYQPLGDA